MIVFLDEVDALKSRYACVLDPCDFEIYHVVRSFPIDEWLYVYIHHFCS